MAAFTFGSLGDILAICQIGLQLGQALGSKRGSTKEYHEFRRDVEAYSCVLMQVAITVQERAGSDALAELDRVTKTSVDECTTALSEELTRLHGKYHESLQPGGSGSTLKDLLRKTQFAFRERERIQALREKLSRDTQRIGVLIELATTKSARVDEATRNSRMTELSLLIEELNDRFAQQEQEWQKDQISQEEMTLHQNTQLAVLGDRMAAQEVDCWRILDHAEGTITALREIKTMVQHASADLQRRSSSSTPPVGLDPTLGKPVYLEDSFGNLLTFSVELVKDWAFFDLLLQHQFRDQKGYNMVLKGDFALEEGLSGNDITRALPWNASVRRGMKVNMSMVFLQSGVLSGLCPRCNTAADAVENVNVQCPNARCGMWFRLSKRIIQAPTLNQDTHKGPWKREPKKIISEPIGMDEPSDFQRVRLITTELKDLPVKGTSRDAWRTTRQKNKKRKTKDEASINGDKSVLTESLDDTANDESEESEESDLDEDESTKFRMKEREKREIRRMTSGSIGKCNFAESIGSASDREDVGAPLDISEWGPSDRRFRRKVDRWSRQFTDPPPPRISELDEPETSDEDMIEPRGLWHIQQEEKGWQECPDRGGRGYHSRIGQAHHTVEQEHLYNDIRAVTFTDNGITNAGFSFIDAVPGDLDLEFPGVGAMVTDHLPTQDHSLSPSRQDLANLVDRSRHGRTSSNRVPYQVIKPSQGDAVLIQFLANGRNPHLAAAAAIEGLSHMT